MPLRFSMLELSLQYKRTEGDRMTNNDRIIIRDRGTERQKETE